MNFSDTDLQVMQKHVLTLVDAQQGLLDTSQILEGPPLPGLENHCLYKRFVLLCQALSVTKGLVRRLKLYTSSIFELGINNFLCERQVPTIASFLQACPLLQEITFSKAPPRALAEWLPALASNRSIKCRLHKIGFSYKSDSDYDYARQQYKDKIHQAIAALVALQSVALSECAASFAELVYGALKGHSAVKHIDSNRTRFDPTPGNMNDCLLSLPKLQSLYLRSDQSIYPRLDGCLASVTDLDVSRFGCDELKLVLQTAPKLTTLALHKLPQDCGAALAQLEHLGSLRVDYPRPENFATILQCQRLKHLQWTRIQGPSTTEHLLPHDDALACLESIGLRDEEEFAARDLWQVLRLVEDIATITSLQIDLSSCPDTKEDLAPIAQEFRRVLQQRGHTMSRLGLLQANSMFLSALTDHLQSGCASSLEALSVASEFVTSNEALPLLGVLAHEAPLSLRHLSLDFGFIPDQDGLLELKGDILAIVRHNQNLETLEIDLSCRYFHANPAKVLPVDELRAALRHNKTLTKIVVKPFHTAIANHCTVTSLDHRLQQMVAKDAVIPNGLWPAILERCGPHHSSIFTVLKHMPW